MADVRDLYPQRRRLRLAPDTYAQAGAICSVTTCTADRRPVFRDAPLAQACIALLRERANANGVLLYAYCLMPDHLHLVASPEAEASITDFVRDLKGRSTRLAWQHGVTGRLWQARFYDRFVRSDEDLHQIVRYVLENPVRRGLVSDWRAYPFSGVPGFDP